MPNHAKHNADASIINKRIDQKINQKILSGLDPQALRSSRNRFAGFQLRNIAGVAGGDNIAIFGSGGNTAGP